MESGEPILYSLYVYDPDVVAPICFLLAYAVSTIWHIWQCHTFETYRLTWLFPVCGAVCFLGYSLREFSAWDYLFIPGVSTQTPLIVYVLSQVCIYICPPLLELENYHILGRTMHYVPSFAPLPPGRVLSTFGALVALVETLNALGVALAADPTSSNPALGANLTVAALAIQLVVIVIFVCIAGTFHHRCGKADIFHGSPEVWNLLVVLYASMSLILIRCIYRLVEHTTGNTKIELDDMDALRALTPILRYEAFFYVFEAAVMLLNSILWNLGHPGRFLPFPGDYSIYVSADGLLVTSEEHVEEDQRGLLARTVNLLMFGLLFRRREVQRGYELGGYPNH